MENCVFWKLKYLSFLIPLFLSYNYKPLTKENHAVIHINIQGDLINIYIYIYIQGEF
jgi:hypothetical protein